MDIINIHAPPIVLFERISANTENGRQYAVVNNTKNIVSVKPIQINTFLILRFQPLQHFVDSQSFVRFAILHLYLKSFDGILLIVPELNSL